MTTQNAITQYRSTEKVLNLFLFEKMEQCMQQKKAYSQTGKARPPKINLQDFKKPTGGNIQVGESPTISLYDFLDISEVKQ